MAGSNQPPSNGSSPSSTASTILEGAPLEHTWEHEVQLQIIEATRGLEKRWHPLEDRLLIYHSMYSYNNKYMLARKIALGLPLVLGGSPILRTVSAVSARLSALRAAKAIPENWYSGSTCRQNTKPFNMQEDIEIMRWHISGRLTLDASIFVPSNRTGSEVRLRKEILCKDALFVMNLENAWDFLRHITLWYEQWEKARNGQVVYANFERMPKLYPRTPEQLDHCRTQVYDRIKQEIRLARGRLTDEDLQYTTGH